MLVGSMLGDGRLVRVTQTTARFVENHQLAQKPYLEWKIGYWGSWVVTPAAPVVWKKGNKDFRGVRFHTVTHPDLVPWHERFYSDGPKQVLDPMLPLDPLALAIWYMDDGCANWWPSIAFGMDAASRELLLRRLKEIWGLEPTWKPCRGDTGNLVFEQEMADPFLNLISPHVPDCMAYKLQPGFLQGRTNKLRRLLEAKDSEIRRLAEAKVPIRKMASHLDVTPQAISRYLQRNNIPHPRLPGRPGHLSPQLALDLLPRQQWGQLEQAEQEEWINRVFLALRLGGFPEDPVHDLNLVLDRLRRIQVGIQDGEISTYAPVGTVACKPYFPGRYKASWKNNPSAFEAWHDDSRLKAAIRLQLDHGDPVHPHRVLRAISMMCRTPTIFRPLVMRAIVQRYVPENGVVWDPCAGYGGRLLGAVAAGVRYLATEVESSTVEGNRRLAEDLGAKAVVLQQPAQDVCWGETVDLVFTSPPYFNVEKYGVSPSQSVAGKTTFDEWVNSFLIPLIDNARKHLQPGGVFALNVADSRKDQVPLVGTVQHLACRQGFTPLEVLWMPLPSLNRRGAREPILVFQRV